MNATRPSDPIRPTATLSAALALLSVAALAGCGDGGEPARSAGGPVDSAGGSARAAADTAPSCDRLAGIEPDSMRTSDQGLGILQQEEGEGRAAAAGDTVVVHYVGCLTDGTKFDASYDRNRPFRFPLGAGEVIAGWDRGLEGMRPGGVRVLRIPPELGYGSRGTPRGPIPPDATLIFQVRLMEVKPDATSGGAG